MAARKTVEDLFIHELSDVYSAEKQITKALPRLARAATNPLLPMPSLPTWPRLRVRSSASTNWWSRQA